MRHKVSELGFERRYVQTPFPQHRQHTEHSRGTYGTTAPQWVFCVPLMVTRSSSTSYSSVSEKEDVSTFKEIYCLNDPDFCEVSLPCHLPTATLAACVLKTGQFTESVHFSSPFSRVSSPAHLETRVPWPSSRSRNLTLFITPMNSRYQWRIRW